MAQFLSNIKNMGHPVCFSVIVFAKKLYCAEMWSTSPDERCLSEESSKGSVQIDPKSYEMPARDGFTVTHFITVADID